MGYNVLKYDNYTFTIELYNSLDECINYYMTQDYHRIMESCKINKAKCFRHVWMTHLVIAIADTNIEVHVIHNKNGKMQHDTAELLINGDKYLYIERPFAKYGEYIEQGDDIHYTIDTHFPTLHAGMYQIFKISLNHIGGHNHIFGDDLEYDKAYYGDVRDRLKTLSPSDLL